MNRLSTILKGFLAMTLLAVIAPAVLATEVKLQTGKGVVGVTFYADDIVRITKTATAGTVMQRRPR